MLQVPETRETTQLEFNAEGADGELPRTFSIIRWTGTEQRDGRTSSGWVQTGPRQRAKLAEGITRRELEAFLADGIGWLAYDGKD
jgi:hypothetical protein